MSEKLKAISSEWERSHIPLNDPQAILPPKIHVCANCGDLVHDDYVVIKQFYTGRMTEVRYFCCDPCHHAFYLKRLYMVGM